MASSKKRDRPLDVSDQFLHHVAGKLTEEWLQLARHLRISDGTLYNKRTDNAGDVMEAKYQMLLCWKRQKGQSATHSELAQALRRTGRCDLSEEVLTEELTARQRPENLEPYPEQGQIHSENQLAPVECCIHRSTIEDECMTATIEEKKMRFKEQLTHKYETLCGSIQPVAFKREKYNIDELFVESGIVFFERKGLGCNSKEHWTSLEKYEDIFTDPRTISNRRIIDGEPGYGKSTLALKIAHDWCHKKSPMHNVEILIHLRLREFRKKKSIFKAIKELILPKDSSLNVKDIKSILDSSSTLTILEGYDEYPGRGEKDTDIDHIIRGNMFQEHDVILTTRTSCIPPHCPPSAVRIRLTGFDDKAKDKYIGKLYGKLDENKIEKFVKFLFENSIPLDLLLVPLFFVAIVGMIDSTDVLEKLNTPTAFFRHYVACFHSHDELKGQNAQKQQRRRPATDHSRLDKEAFERLSAKSQRIIWDRDELRSKIGDDLYDEYVGIGILIEEDVFNGDDIDYRTQTRFIHKMFVEWFAAHHLARECVQSGVENKSSLISKYIPFLPFLNPKPKRSDHEAAAEKNKTMMGSLNPEDVHYIFRFACGLSSESAPQVIEYLAKDGNAYSLTQLCILECGGSFEEISNTVTFLCSRGICITYFDETLVQTGSVEMLKYAGENNIAVQQVELKGCLQHLTPTEEPDLKLFSFHHTEGVKVFLPVIKSLRKLVVKKCDEMKNREVLETVLKYSSMCQELTELHFTQCMLPRRVEITTPLTVLKARNVTVEWKPNNKVYNLNLESGQWESTHYRPNELKDEEFLWKVYQEVQMIGHYNQGRPRIPIRTEIPLDEAYRQMTKDNDGEAHSVECRQPTSVRDENPLWELFERIEVDDDGKAIKVYPRKIKGESGKVHNMESRGQGPYTKFYRWMPEGEDHDGQTMQLRRRKANKDEGHDMEIGSQIQQMQWSYVQREMTDEEYEMEERMRRDATSCCVII